jgi:hypothetical protein
VASPAPGPPVSRKANASTPAKRRLQPITAATIKTFLQDGQLRARCADLLRARGHFDRVFREATTVLDDRLKATTEEFESLPGAP